MDNELLQRYIEGNVTTEEAETVIDWLEADENNIKEYRALQKLYTLFLFNRPELQQPASQKKRKWAVIRKPAYELMKAAVLVLLIWGGMQLLTERRREEKAPPTFQTLFVPAGQRAELTLPDGSVVWLNARSKITYPSRFGEENRLITLDGEAYFSVKHRDKQDFVVKTKQMDIRVLGTEFCVTAYAEYPVAEVALLKGSIELRPAYSNHSYLMKVNEQVRLSGSKLQVYPISSYDYFKWREGLICFDNETVENIISKLQLYFDVKIDVKKRSILKHRYSGKFRTKDGVEQVLKVLQIEQRFTYIKDSEQNVITIK
jgi:ferric-dicitrate binding protein FerR (iron transport regulator)